MPNSAKSQVAAAVGKRKADGAGGEGEGASKGKGAKRVREDEGVAGGAKVDGVVIEEEESGDVKMQEGGDAADAEEEAALNA